MIKPKKTIAFVCAAAILLSPSGAFAASPSDFVDFPNDWSTGAMTAAVDNGLLGGVGDGRIAPRGEVTRAQMAAIINRAFGAEKTASLTGYTDVAANAWYATDMAKAVQMGTFSGSGNGLLEPDRAITREEARVRLRWRLVTIRRSPVFLTAHRFQPGPEEAFRQWSLAAMSTALMAIV